MSFLAALFGCYFGISILLTFLNYFFLLEFELNHPSAYALAGKPSVFHFVQRDGLWQPYEKFILFRQYRRFLNRGTSLCVLADTMFSLHIIQLVALACFVSTLVLAPFDSSHS